MFLDQLIPFKSSIRPHFQRKARARCFFWIAFIGVATTLVYHEYAYTKPHFVSLATLPALTRARMDHIRLQDEVNGLKNYANVHEEWVNPESPPKVTSLPTSRAEKRTRSHPIPDELADRFFCPTFKGHQHPCKVLLPVWVSNDEATGVQSLLQLTQLAKMLGRILVLPNIDIAGGKLGTCSSEPVQRYYTMPVVASSHGTPRAFDDFLMWTSLREGPPTTHVLIVHQKPKSSGSDASPVHRHCLELKAPHLPVTNSSVSTLHPPKRNHHASSSLVGFDSHLLKHAQALSADVLLLEWHLTNPVFHDLDGILTPFSLRSKIYRVVNTVMRVSNISLIVLWEQLPQSSGDLANCIHAMFQTAQGSTHDLTSQGTLFLATPFSTRVPLDVQETALHSHIRALAPSQYTILDISDALLTVTGQPGSRRNFSTWMDLSEFTRKGTFTESFTTAVELVLASQIRIVLTPEGSCGSAR
jgi:hypothetical protein